MPARRHRLAVVAASAGERDRAPRHCHVRAGEV